MKQTKNMNTMYDTLLQLPLFQGFSQEDFTNILGKVKLNFTKHKAGAVLAKKSDKCEQLTFVLNGEISSSTSDTANSYTFTEFFQAPCLIEPQSLFGMSTCYAATHVAHTATHTVSISKACLINIMFEYEIFRFSYMNIISSRAQAYYNRLWTKTPDSTEKRIAHFILSHVERNARRKVLKIKMEDLACITNDARLSVSKALKNMQEEGLIILHRGEVTIPDASKLEEYYLSPTVQE